MRDLSEQEELGIKSLVDFLTANKKVYGENPAAQFLRGIYLLEGPRGVADFFDRLDDMKDLGKLPLTPSEQILKKENYPLLPTSRLAEATDFGTRRQFLKNMGIATAGVVTNQGYKLLTQPRDRRPVKQPAGDALSHGVAQGEVANIVGTIETIGANALEPLLLVASTIGCAALFTRVEKHFHDKNFPRIADEILKRVDEGLSNELYRQAPSR